MNTRCNYCSLKSLRSRYEEKGMVVTLRPGSIGTMALVHHPDEEPDTSEADDNPQFKAAYMSIPNHCCC